MQFNNESYSSPKERLSGYIITCFFASLILIFCGTSQAQVHFSRMSENNSAVPDKAAGTYSFNHKNRALLKSLFPDTVTCKYSNGYVRYCYNFDYSKKTMEELYQVLIDNNWNNNSLISQSFVNNKKTTSHYRWNDLWQDDFRTSEEFDQAGNLTKISREFYNNGWHTDLSKSMTYEDNILKSMLTELWYNDYIVSRIRETYNYENGFLQSFIVQSELNETWINLQKGEWKRNNSGTPVEYNYYLWDKTSWRDSSRAFWFYNAAGLDTLYYNQRFQENTWINFISFSSEYDTRANKISESYYKWDRAWMKWLRFEWKFNPENLLECEIYQRGNNNIWENSTRNTRLYNSRGLIETELFDKWVETVWIKGTMSKREYDSENNITAFTFREWKSDWELADGYVDLTDPLDNYFAYYGSDIVFRYNGVSDIAHKNSEMNYIVEQNFPNPFNPETRLRITLPAASHLKVTVFDIRGRHIKVLCDEYTAAGLREIIWYGTDELNQQAASGVYFYSVNDGKNITVKKMLLLR